MEQSRSRFVGTAAGKSDLLVEEAACHEVAESQSEAALVFLRRKSWCLRDDHRQLHNMPVEDSASSAGSQPLPVDRSL